jgi:nickel transport protein
MVKAVRNVLFAIGALMMACNASAHNVIGGVYAIGDVIEGEIGFSNGDMAAAGTEVIIFDAMGEELGRVTTNDEGFFTFKATKRIQHNFYANLSSGHVFEIALPADELPDTLPGPDGAPVVSAGDVATTENSQGMIANQAELQAMIEKAVAKQVKPLRQEILALKEKAGMQDIIGGIGYIFGLCGIGIWWRQRKLDQQAANKV